MCLDVPGIPHQPLKAVHWSEDAMICKMAPQIVFCSACELQSPVARGKKCIDCFLEARKLLMRLEPLGRVVHSTLDFDRADPVLAFLTRFRRFRSSRDGLYRCRLR